MGSFTVDGQTQSVEADAAIPPLGSVIELLREAKST
jgi:hypothetical protein